MRGLATCIVLTLILVLAPATSAAATVHPDGHGPCAEGVYRITHAMSYWTRVTRAQALIRCAFTWAGIPDQTDTALYVAKRESGFTPWAKNPWTATACRPWSGYSYGSCGMFQHLSRYWPARVRTFMKPWWMPHRWPTINPLNERANALVTALMVRSGGWGPWSMP